MKKRILSVVIAMLMVIPFAGFAAEEEAAALPEITSLLYEDFSAWSDGVQVKPLIGTAYPTALTDFGGEYEIINNNGDKDLRLRKINGISGDIYPLWRVHVKNSMFSSSETIVAEYRIKVNTDSKTAYLRGRTGQGYGTHVPLFYNGKIYEGNSQKKVIGAYDGNTWVTVTNILYIDSYLDGNSVKTLKRDIYIDGEYKGTYEEPYKVGEQDFADAAGTLCLSFNLCYFPFSTAADEVNYVDIDYIKMYSEASEFSAICESGLSETVSSINMKFSNHPSAEAFILNSYIQDSEGNPVGGIKSGEIISTDKKTGYIEYKLNFENALKPSADYVLYFANLPDNIGRTFSGEFPFTTPPARKYAEEISLSLGGVPAEELSDGEYEVTYNFINDEALPSEYILCAALTDSEGILSELQMLPLSAELTGDNAVSEKLTLSGTDGKTLKLFAVLKDSFVPASAVYELSDEGAKEASSFNWKHTLNKEEIGLKNSINGDTQVITAKASAELNRPATLLVMKEGKTLADIDFANPLENIVSIISGEFAEEGFAYKIPDVQGNYEAYLYTVVSEKSGAESFEYFGAEYIAGGLEIIKDIEADEVEAFLEDYAKAFTIDLTAYNEYTPEEKERFGKSVEASKNELEGKAFEGFTDFSRAIEDAETLISIKTNADVKETMEALAGETGKLLYKEVISENAKTETENAVLKEEPLTLKEYASFFDEAAVLCGIEKSENYSQTDEIIKKSTEVTGIDLTSYSNLKKPKNVTVALSNKSFASPEALKDAFDDAVADQKRAEALGGSSGGSSGGGGNGGSAAIKSQVGKTEMDAVVPEKEEVINSMKKFTDLAGFKWAEEAIHSLREKGIVNGKTEDTFAPADNITRAEFAKMTVEAFGLKRIGLGYEFKDVAATDWFFEAVLSAYENGVINGTGNDNFAPSENITRQDAAVILYRASEKKLALSGEKEFKDSGEVSDYAKNAVSVFGANGIINGFEDGSFAPKMPITRAQAAVIINNILNK